MEQFFIKFHYQPDLKYIDLSVCFKHHNCKAVHKKMNAHRLSLWSQRLGLFLQEPSLLNDKNQTPSLGFTDFCGDFLWLSLSFLPFVSDAVQLFTMLFKLWLLDAQLLLSYHYKMFWE